MELECNFSVDEDHIKQRGHHEHLRNYFQIELRITPDASDALLRKVFSRDVAHAVFTLGLNPRPDRYVACIEVRCGIFKATVTVVVLKTPNCLTIRTAYPNKRCTPAYSGLCLD